MDLAIGVIIGAAFQNIVSALTNDFITPLIAAITGKTDENGGVELGGQFTINGATFNYGDFISAIINFLIMALILFLLIKGVNKLMSLGHKKEEEETAPLTRKCPYCYGEIDIKANQMYALYIRRLRQRPRLSDDRKWNVCRFYFYYMRLNKYETFFGRPLL